MLYTVILQPAYVSNQNLRKVEKKLEGEKI